MQGNHRIWLEHSWARGGTSTTLQSRHGLSTSDCVSLFRKHGGLARWASAVGRHARSKAPPAFRPERSYIGMTGSLTSRGVISGV